MAKSTESLGSKTWEMHPGESTKAYEAFCVYRDMGTQRSLSKVAEQLQKSDTLMGRWSRSYNWVKRAAEWDVEQDRIARQEQQKEISKMRKRHAKLASDVLDKVAQALEAMDIDEIKPGNIPSMIAEASKLERISRGDVGEVVEERQGEAAPSPVTFYLPDNGRDKQEEE